MSEGVEWGLHCMLLLVEAPPGVSYPRRLLAEHYGLPEAYLAKHLKALSQAGLHTPRQGRAAGFASREPQARLPFSTWSMPSKGHPARSPAGRSASRAPARLVPRSGLVSARSPRSWRLLTKPGGNRCVPSPSAGLSSESRRNCANATLPSSVTKFPTEELTQLGHLALRGSSAFSGV